MQRSRAAALPGAACWPHCWQGLPIRRPIVIHCVSTAVYHRIAATCVSLVKSRTRKGSWVVVLDNASCSAQHWKCRHGVPVTAAVPSLLPNCSCDTDLPIVVLDTKHGAKRGQSVAHTYSSTCLVRRRGQQSYLWDNDRVRSWSP